MANGVENRNYLRDRDPDRRKASDILSVLTGNDSQINRNEAAVKEGGEIEQPTYLAARLREDWTSLSTFLDVKRVADIRQLAVNSKFTPTKISLASKRERANLLVQQGFDIPPNQIRRTLVRYAKTGDGTINHAQADLPPNYTQMGADSPIKAITHPVDLAIAGFTAPNDTDRFRAIRKLLLMQAIAEVNLAKKSGQIEEACLKFKTFVEGKVFDPLPPNDEKFYMYSRHDTSSETFDAVERPVVLSSKDLEGGVDLAARTGLEMGEKLLEMQRRTFTTASGEKHVAYIPIPEKPKEGEHEIIRTKPIESTVLKIIRKDQDPEAAVRDQLGLMVIFENERGLRAFVEHIVERATHAGSSTRIKAIQDTIKGGPRSVRSPGASKDMRWYKAYLLMFGIKPEFVGLTLEGAADYFHGKDSHRRYELARSLRTVIPRLIPPRYYDDYDPGYVNAYAAKKVEREIRDPYRLYIGARKRN